MKDVNVLIELSGLMILSVNNLLSKIKRAKLILKGLNNNNSNQSGNYDCSRIVHCN